MSLSADARLARAFYALSDPIRLRIVRLLAGRELCVCDLMAALEMGQSRISFHVGVLRTAGLVTSRKLGRWNAYRLRAGNRLQERLVEIVREEGPPAAGADERRLLAYLERKRRLLPDGSTCCPETASRATEQEP